MKTSRALALAIVPIAATLACGSATTAANGASGGIAGDTTATVASTGTGAGRESAAPAAATGTPTGNAAAASGNPVAKPGEPAPPTSTKPVTVSRNPAKRPTVTGVRFARHAGFDRVVIDLAGPTTGYSVGWTDALTYDASGEPVGLTGGAYLQVRLTPAAAHDSAGNATWKGPRKVAANLPNVRHIVNNGDFEGVVSVGLVLARKAGFRVLAQSGPSRIVIDVAH
ncbi:AMIN-like domain-containing (lipo)protein [Microtetraspora fusca]|uniref:AMIN-like domain-containing (lipo)protein n=1 Tax=Microtetraspora fusca TaxID=1997 RepID=UPI000A3FF855|nr:hypothetical protein [Microtetraspora fusca]